MAGSECDTHRRWTAPERCLGSRVCGKKVDRYAQMHTLAHMSASDSDRLLALARRRGLIRAGDVTRAGIHSQALTRLVRQGRLERVARGLYRVAGLAVTEHHGLVLAARAAPRGVVCLLSALSFHGIGTEVPFQVWLAIDRARACPAAPAAPPARGSLLRRSADRGDRDPPHRGSARARLQRGQDAGRPVQVPAQGRARRGAGGAARGVARPPFHDGRADTPRPHLSRGARDAALPGVAGGISRAPTGLAHSVQVRLVRHAEEIGVDPNLVLTRYATERLLYRLSISRHAGRFF